MKRFQSSCSAKGLSDKLWRVSGVICLTNSCPSRCVQGFQVCNGKFAIPQRLNCGDHEAMHCFKWRNNGIRAWDLTDCFIGCRGWGTFVSKDLQEYCDLEWTYKRTPDEATTWTVFFAFWMTHFIRIRCFLGVAMLKKTVLIPGNFRDPSFIPGRVQWTLYSTGDII